jgi:hypothetical protein
MNWANSRLALYGSGFIASAITIWLQTKGWYDFDTGLTTIPPFDVTQVVSQGISWLGNGLAAVAVIKKWGKRT